MEQTIISLLGGELGVTTLLLLFILGLLTRRFVPWWVHDAIVEELKVYKKEAPELLREVRRLLAIVEDQEEEEEVGEFQKHSGGMHRRPRKDSRSNTRRRDRHYE